jgi:indole-3-glycerol phosphate synthase
MGTIAQADEGTILGRIMHARRLEVDHRKRVLPEAALRYGVNAATPLRDFASALAQDSLNIIAELKPASPSKGILRDPFDPVELARSFELAGAAVLSVLTEGEFFRGSLKNLRDARNSVKLPVLRKDFIFDPFETSSRLAASSRWNHSSRFTPSPSSTARFPLALASSASTIGT